MTAARLRGWLLVAAIALGLALPALTSCSGSRGGRRHAPRVKTQRGKKPVRSHRPARHRPRHRHARHPHAHPHPHSASPHHHHPHPHPHLEGPDGHHHPY